MADVAPPEQATRRLGPVPAVWALVAGAVLLGLVLGIRDRREFLFDDAAISFRYAWRIAHGFGFTYNDGDRTNGASAPLFTLLLAALSRLGADLEVAAKVVGAICYATACGLVAWLGDRLGGLACGAIASGLLLLSMDFRLQALSGMESSFAVVLGLGALAFVVVDRPVLAGVLVGLAVVNKLDAGMLAAAIVVAFAVVERRFPTRLAVAAVVTALPWFAFSTWYFGSPVPYSATQKLTVVQNATNDPNPLWVLRALGADRALVPLLLTMLSILLVPALAREARSLATTLVALVAWAMLHLAFFSLANLGDPYSWYVTVIYPLLSVGAGVFLVRGPSLLPEPTRRRAVIGAWCVGLVLVAIPKLGQVKVAATVLAEGHQVNGYERFEGTRHAAGRYLGREAEPGEVIETCFGWIAYGAPTNPIDEICPLSTRKPVGPTTWGVEIATPDRLDVPLPDQATVMAEFVAGGPEEGRTIVFRFDDP